DHVFNSNDDIVIPLAPQYTLGISVVTLQVPSGALAAGMYRLTVQSNAGSSLHDLAGISLDGDFSGTAGGAYVRTFTVFALGDVNLDGAVDVADISALETALSNLTTYQTLHGLSAADAVAIADIDHDGHITNRDVQSEMVAIANAMPAPAFTRGDINLDGAVDAADISALGTALSNLTTYQTLHGLSAADALAVADRAHAGHITHAG